MAKVPKRVIRDMQIRINSMIKWGYAPGSAWSHVMTSEHASYLRLKQESIDYGFNNQSSHGAGTQAEANH